MKRAIVALFVAVVSILLLCAGMVALAARPMPRAALPVESRPAAVTESILLPLVAKSYDLGACRDQSPGNLADLGVPAATTRFDSPDIAEVVENEPERFDVFQKEIHGKLITVAIAKDFEITGLTKEEWGEFAFETWAIYWKEFGGFPYESFTVVVGHGLPHGDRGAFGQGFQTSSGRTDWASHEIYHAWNGNAFRQEGERTWFMEGVTTYYGSIRQQLQYPYESILRGYYREFSTLYGPEHNCPLGEMSMNDADYNHTYVAHKGALVAYLLDIELHKTSHHLGEVARALYERYGIETQGAPTNSEILAVFNDVSGADFTEFFERYIYGIEPLPLSESSDFGWVCHD